MSNSIISIGGRVFQRFLYQLTPGLPKPNAKFIRNFLCGVLFSDNLVLTHIAAKVPCASRLTAIAKRGDWLVYKKVHLPDNPKSLYVVAYRTAGYNEPVILLTDMVAEDFVTDLKIRNWFRRRWHCQTAVEFLKSRIGLERFAVRSYKSIQRLIFFASLDMGYLSYLQYRCKNIRQRLDDHLRYSREHKSFWFYRLLTGLQDALFSQDKKSLSVWCRPTP
jgi:hypothetical protein